MKKVFITLFLIFGYLLILPLFFQPILAVQYSLVAPSDTLTRGETYKFTINIDTGSNTVETAQIGMTYDSTYLQYVSTTPGVTMTSVSTAQSETNRLILTGTNTDGFSGSGVFAYVEFKLIATSAGSTELCTLWTPTATTTPTSASAVTNLPTSGVTISRFLATGIGIAFITLYGLFTILDKKIAFKKPKKK